MLRKFDLIGVPVLGLGLGFALFFYTTLDSIRRFFVDAWSLVEESSDSGSAVIRNLLFLIAVPFTALIRFVKFFLSITELIDEVGKGKKRVPLYSSWMDSVKWLSEPFPPKWYDFIIGTLLWIIAGGGILSTDLISGGFKRVRRLFQDPSFDAAVVSQLDHTPVLADISPRPNH